MSLLKFAQNIEYLIKIGVPVEESPDMLTWLKSIPEDIKWMLPKIKENQGLTVEQYRQIWRETKERNTINPVIVEWANKISPAHAKWLIRLATEKKVRMGEDDHKLRTVLRTFEIIKERGLIPPEKRDILKYKTQTDLYEVVKPFLMMGHTDEILIPEGTEGLLYSENGVQVFQTTNPEIAIRFGKGTNWCVRYIETARAYLAEGALNFVFLDTRKVALIHQQSGQVKETDDTPLRNYSIIRRVHSVLEELGIDKYIQNTNKHGDYNKDYGDFEDYNAVLEKGVKINEQVEKYIKAGVPAANIITKLYPDLEDQKDCLLYLEEQHFKDPSIQKLCVNAFMPSLKSDIIKIYRQLPRQIQSIPEIFQACKAEFIKKILDNPGNYSECSNDLKKLPEIQKARFDGYVNIIRKDPEMNEANIPEEYLHRPEIVLARFEGWVEFIRKNPEKDPPDDIKDRPEVRHAQTEGWYEKIDREPYSYSECPDYIKNTDRAQGIAWDASIRLVEEDPNNYYNLVPVEYKDDPYVYETVIKKWIELIRKNPLYMYQCPDEFRELDVIQNAYSRESEPVEEMGQPQPELTSDEIQSSFIRNWVQRIQARPEDYALVPRELKSNPEVFNVALQGWKDRIRKNPYQINFCPPEFKKHPAIREQLHQSNPQMRHKQELERERARQERREERQRAQQPVQQSPQPPSQPPIGSKNWYQRFQSVQNTDDDPLMRYAMSGEYWFVDGQAIGAEDDSNHEIHVIQAILANYSDALDRILRGQGKIGDYDNWDPEDFTVFELRKIGLSEEEINVVYGRADARPYAMKHFKWVRVRGNHCQAQTLDGKTLQNIANGIWEILDDSAEQQSFTIEIMEPHQFFREIPYAIIAEGDALSVRRYGQRVRPGEIRDTKDFIPSPGNILA